MASPRRAAVTVTTGLLDVMDREELEGVLGHELSHIKNYDTRLLLVVSTLFGLAGLLASVHHQGRVHRRFDTHLPLTTRIAALEHIRDGVSA